MCIVLASCGGAQRAFEAGCGCGWRRSIPTGSGLGGASSDAAATMEGLERLTDREAVAKPSICSLAAAIGFRRPPLSAGRHGYSGAGGAKTFIRFPIFPHVNAWWFFPASPVSTAEAYREASLRLTTKAKSRSIRDVGAWPQFPLLDWGPAENDFERVVFARWPELARLKRQLIRAGAEIASLTGSGSAVYAIFESARQLLHASKLIPKGWLIFQVTHVVTKLITGDSFASGERRGRQRAGRR